MLDITPAPWEVEKGNEYGHYFISKVAHEQSEWIDEGYEISDEEGDRRTEVAGIRDENNRRLIQAAPKLFKLCREFQGHLGKHPLGKGLKQTFDELNKLLEDLEGGEENHEGK